MKTEYIHTEIDGNIWQGTSDYSPESMVWYGRVSGIGDLVVYEADRREDLQKSFEEAIEDYIDTLNLLNRK